MFMIFETLIDILQCLTLSKNWSYTREILDNFVLKNKSTFKEMLIKSKSVSIHQLKVTLGVYSP